MATKKSKDLTPKSPAKVKGGVAGRPNEYSGNDNLTLVRGAKPSKKRDLPPRKPIKGGAIEIKQS